MKSDKDELVSTLKLIIEIIEEEADKVLEKKRPNWKKAATQAVEEAYGVLSRIEKTK